MHVIRIDHVSLRSTAPAQAALVVRLERLGIAYVPERQRDSTTLEVMVPRT